MIQFWRPALISLICTMKPFEMRFMSTFVLVPGAWSGGSIWRRAAARIEERGHETHAITLTGMGERVHLASSELGIETAIQDVVNVIEYNDLEDIVLVGHSLGAKISAAVADRVPYKIRLFVVLDGYVAEKTRKPQASFRGQFPVEGAYMPFPVKFLDAAGKDVKGADREWLIAKATPLPVRYYSDPITLSANYDSLKRAYIFCRDGGMLDRYSSTSSDGDLDSILNKVLDGPYSIMDSGHWPMITRPRELAENILVLSTDKTV